MSAVQTVIKPDKKQMKIDIFGCKPEDITPGDRKTAITGYELRHRIEALVSGITDKKIAHRYHGDGAATAPGMMILPSIPLSWLFRKRDANVILGYAAHEISHQLETPFDMVKTIFADTNKPTADEIQLKNWWNAVEDYRIEKLTRKAYPGFPMLIGETRDHSARRFNEAVDEGVVEAERLGNPYALGAVALTWIGARLNQYPTTEHEKALSHLSNDLRAWVEGWEEALAKVETPDEALDLAKAIMANLQAKPEDQELEEEEKSDDQQDGDTDDSDDSQGDQPDKNSNQSDGSQDQSNNSGSSSDTSDTPEDKPEAENAQSDNETDGDDEPGDGDGQEDGDTEESQNNAANEDGDAETGSDEAGDESSDADADNGVDCDGQDNTADDSQDGSGEQESDAATGEPSSNSQNPSSNQSADNADSGQPNASEQGKDETGTASDPVNPAPAPQVTEEQKQAEPAAADLEIDEIMEQLGQSVGHHDRCQQDIDESPAAASSQDVERNERCYAELRRTLGPAGARSAGVLRRMLQSQDRVRTVRGLEEGRLDLSRLVPIINGSKEIYTDRHINPAINTAVSLLIDNSGSMGGEPLRICQQASIVLDSAISETGTDLEISGFTSISQAIVYRYRRFGQKGRQAASTLGGMQDVMLGGTPVGLPMLEAWRRLHGHKAPRKLMIVISDGEAGDPDQARAAHDLIVFQGGIVVGIAIGNARPLEKWCNNVQAIQNIDELPKALTAIVQHVMTQKIR